MTEPVVGREGGVWVGTPGSVDDECIDVTTRRKWQGHRPYTVLRRPRKRSFGRIPAVEITDDVHRVGARGYVDKSDNRIRNRELLHNSARGSPDRRLAVPVKCDIADENADSNQAGRE